MTYPETVTDAVRLLSELGYVDELIVGPKGLEHRRHDEFESVDSAIVDYVFRFEGLSDPADEAIVLGIRCPTLGLRGVVVSGYGPGVDSEHEAVLAALVLRAPVQPQ
ncbi:MAG: hypothetical protein QOD39_3134 [Mycobacterium sp.]|nr:hypothetical protein [Mycobacterium sp.]